MVQWWEMLKLRKYLVEFVVWERIPSSLPFGTDVVPKSGEHLKVEWELLVWRKLW